ncbi:hypothetical protein CJF30_00002240 [Rutstroemia sp. NJR-2017a BBW]|nr:hypothetical protein CJF30_00002240 [Rutstroemia sp. NJR-2017a BBW]
MNNDPSPTVPGPSDSNQNERRRTRRARRQTRTPFQRRFEAQIKKKYELTRLLMLNLDLSVYGQLCSFFQLLLRGISQFVILTPKPRHVRQPPQSSSERMGKILTGYLKKTPEVPPPSTQDHDAEERGVLRDNVTGPEDIEMQTLDPAVVPSQPHSRVEVPEGDEAREDLLAEPDGDENDDTPLDIFWSGTAVIGDFNVIDTLRNQLAVSAHGSGTELQTRSLLADASRRSNAIAQSLRRGLNS